MLARTLSFRPLSGDIARMSREMDRLFDTFTTAPGAPSGSAAGRMAPAVNLWQDADNLYAEAELPGVCADDLEVTAHDDTLTIKGARNTVNDEHTKNTIRAERYHGAFERTLTLPVEVDAERITASLKDGVLTVQLPKTKASRPRKVAVSAG